MDWSVVAEVVEQTAGVTMTGARAWPIGGGCINSAFRLDGPDQSFFVKINDASQSPMFEAEAQGLELLASCEDGPRVPAVVATGVAGPRAYLVLEYVQLRSARAEDFTQLGERLAALHRVESARFGLGRENTIGLTPQLNGWWEDWVDFLRERRLGYQLELAANNGYAFLREEAQPLLERLEVFFAGYRPAASLLHGDLWSGNVAYDRAGTPVIFDPACYYGDRETDLAMTELFGGFDARFYRAYDEAYPRDAGYGVRKWLYQLYHVLNHLNLFGGGYRAQARDLIRRLTAEL